MAHRFRKHSLIAALLATGVAGGSALMAPAAHAEEGVADGLNVSVAVNLELNSHFVSYGLDVWGAGRSWGSKSTLNPSIEFEFDFNYVSVVFGTWWDVNDNAASSIGGDLQEIDVWVGASFDYEGFTFGVMYQAWMYGGGTEKILDISVAYDDSELWGGDFALNPSVVFHKRLASSNIDAPPSGSENGWVIELGIEPEFEIISHETYPVTLAVPVALGLFPEKGFHGTQSNGRTTKTGYGYFSIGANLTVPLSFVPASYGAW
jgi:hypothetical protein